MVCLVFGMDDMCDNKINLVLDKLLSLEKKFADFEEKYDYMEFQIKKMEVEKEYEKNPKTFLRKTEKDFLEELKEW